MFEQTDDDARLAKSQIDFCATEIKRIMRGEGALISVRYPLSITRCRDVQDLAKQIFFWAEQLSKECENEVENTN